MNETIRKCEEADIPLLFDLFKEVYRSNPRLQERDYFDWQYQQSPFQSGTDYTFWILWKGAHVGAFLGCVPIQFWFAGDIRWGCWTHMWHSFDQDGSGLKLLATLNAEYDHRFHIGLTPDSTRVYQAYGIPVLDEIPRWVGVLDAEAVCTLFRVVNPGDEARIRWSAEQLQRFRNAEAVTRCMRFDPDEEFLLSWWPDVIGHTRRTGRYLNWRYVDIPRHNYRAIRDAGQFAVYRIESIKYHPEAVVRIVEWTFHGGWAERALATIARDGQREGAILIDFIGTARNVGSELVRLGFFADDTLTSRIPYLFRPIHYTQGIRMAIDLPPHRRRRHVDFGQWYITKGDSDIDRVKL